MENTSIETVEGFRPIAPMDATIQADALNQEVAVEDPAIEEVVEEERQKAYTLRPLIASDMGAICKIVTTIGIKQLKDCFKAEEFEKGNEEQVGFSVVFDIAGIVISNIPKAEDEIRSFLSSLTGLKDGELRVMPFADYGELIMDVVMKEEFRDFFNRVMKLFNR